MASSALLSDLASAYLGQPGIIGYGLVRGTGILVMQHQMADNTTIAFYLLGEGPWDSIVRLWINRKAVALPSANVHFHPGVDGDIGNGMSAVSTGGDQHVDAFWSSTVGITPVTFSRYAWLALKVPPDPGAPSAAVEVLADYQALKCRIFDSSGVQTAFQWTQNPAWWIADRLIRRFILREAKANQPLLASEKARIDWPSFVDAASYFDGLIGAPPQYVNTSEIDQPAGSSVNYTVSIDVTANALLVFACRETNVNLVVDNKGNTWVKLFNNFWYALNCVAGATIVTVHRLITDHLQAAIVQYATSYPLSAPDVSANVASGTGTAATSSNVTTTASGDLLLGFGFNGTTNSPSYTAGSGYSLRTSSNKNVFIEDKIQTILGTDNASLTSSGSIAWSIGIVAFKAQTGTGIKRFSDGGMISVDGSLTEDRILEQLLLMCRSYTLERSGKISLYPDLPRPSVFVFGSGNVKPGTFAAKKSNLRSGKNQIAATWREISLASGSSDSATRFSVGAKTFDHEAHQRAIGVRGPGLSLIPKSIPLALDFGNNTFERVARLSRFQLLRLLGDDVDSNTPYSAPFTFEFTGFEDSLAVDCGDVVTLDPTLSEEFGGNECEVIQVVENPDGTRDLTCLQYEPDSFIESAPAGQLVEAPVPGTGLSSAFILDANNNLQIDPSSDRVAKKGSVPPAFAAAITYTSTTTTLTIAWDYRSPNQIFRTDSANTQLIPHGSQAITGLSATTTYKTHPFYDENISDFSMLIAGGVGTPAWAHTATSRAKIAEMSRQDHIPLAATALSMATTSSGTGGGSGGGDGSCLRIRMFVRERTRGVIRAESVRSGDELWTENDKWIRVLRVRLAAHNCWIVLRCNNGARLAVTATHPFTLADGSMRKAAELSLESEIPCPTGVAFPTSIRSEFRMSKKVCVTCEGPHVFYASGDGRNWLLTHNVLYPT